MYELTNTEKCKKIGTLFQDFGRLQFIESLTYNHSQRRETSRPHFVTIHSRKTFASLKKQNLNNVLWRMKKKNVS